jgi:hypothetical protein
VKKQQFEMDRFCALNVMNYYATKGTQLPADIESVVGIVPLLITEIWPVAVAPAVKIPAQYLLGLGLNRQQKLLRFEQLFVQGAHATDYCLIRSFVLILLLANP